MEEQKASPETPVEAAVMPQLLLVTWRDCETLSEWVDIPTVRELAERHRIVVTVGFEIGGDDDHLILSSSHESTFGKVAGCWIIPRSQIQDVRKLSA